MKRIIKVTEEVELLEYLRKKTDYSNKKLKSMIEHNQILINQKKIKLPCILKKGDEIFLTTEKIISTPFSIIYEDNLFLVVNKKSGLLTVHTFKEKEETLEHQVYEYLHQKREKGFVVHRLDKETSGIIIFTKKEEVKNILQENWNEIVKSRKYIAVVHGSIKGKGTIRSYLKEEKNTFVHSSSKGKLAITNYYPKKTNGNYTLLDISIETGRKNQIRVHMKENQTPVVGDKKYGIKDNSSRLMLHAYELIFVYPKNNQVYQFQAPIPNDFLKMVS